MRSVRHIGVCVMGAASPRCSASRGRRDGWRSVAASGCCCFVRAAVLRLPSRSCSLRFFRLAMTQQLHSRQRCGTSHAACTVRAAWVHTCTCGAAVGRRTAPFLEASSASASLLGDAQRPFCTSASSSAASSGFPHTARSAREYAHRCAVRALAGGGAHTDGVVQRSRARRRARAARASRRGGQQGANARACGLFPPRLRARACAHAPRARRRRDGARARRTRRRAAILGTAAMPRTAAPFLLARAPPRCATSPARHAMASRTRARTRAHAHARHARRLTNVHASARAHTSASTDIMCPSVLLRARNAGVPHALHGDSRAQAAAARRVA